MNAPWHEWSRSVRHARPELVARMLSPGRANITRPTHTRLREMGSVMPPWPLLQKASGDALCRCHEWSSLALSAALDHLLVSLDGPRNLPGRATRVVTADAPTKPSSAESLGSRLEKASEEETVTRQGGDGHARSSKANRRVARQGGWCSVRDQPAGPGACTMLSTAGMVWHDSFIWQHK